MKDCCWRNRPQESALGGGHPCLSVQNCWPIYLAAGQAGKKWLLCQSHSQTALQPPGCKKPSPNSTWPSPTSHLHCQPWSLPNLTLLPPSGQLMQRLRTELDCLHWVLKGTLSYLVFCCHGSWCCLGWYFFFGFIVKPLKLSTWNMYHLILLQYIWDTEGAMQDSVIFFNFIHNGSFFITERLKIFFGAWDEMHFMDS